tara:strand:- start:19 stop:1113 length:1095 start_codon:yes stop_codon:yes gene_type:complete
MDDYRNFELKSPRRRMSKKKYAAFAAAVFFISAGALIATFAAGDWYVHQKLQKKGMYNIWGYRGPVAGPKKRGEFRIAVLGGSTALGYGAPVGQSFPAHLERMLNEKPRKGGPEFYRVVNLAWNNEGAHSFVHTLKDYAYLSYDAVIFYTGYNDLTGKNLAVFRHRSPVFKLTGYMPLLPGMMLDKAKMLRLGLGIDDINMGRKRTNFSPGILDRTKAAALELGGEIARSLEKQLGRLTASGRIEAESREEGCGKRWAFYCGEVHAAARYALEKGAALAVVTQPYISDNHIAQQKTLEEMLRQRFGGEPRLAHFNLGEAVDLKDRGLAFDGIHLTSRGNEIVAKNIAAALMDFLRKQNRSNRSK